MAKESDRLVVFDHDREYAQETDSLLRNSGIALRVTAADSSEILGMALEEEQPALLIVGDISDTGTTLEEIAGLAAQHATPVAFRCGEAFTASAPAITAHGPCSLYSSDHRDQLVGLVRNAVACSGGSRVRESMQGKVDELEGRFNQLLDSAREAVAYIHEGLHVYANQAYLNIVGVDAFDDVATLSLLELLSSEDADMKALLRDMSGGEYSESTMRMSLQRPDGDSLDVDVRFSPARFDGEGCIQMMLQPVGDRADVEAELERLRHIDPVTQLDNRQHFIQRLADAIAKRTEGGPEAALLYLEPDGLEQVQENLGLTQADAHLADLAKLVSKQLQKGDLAGRISDSGLAVLLTRDGREQLEAGGQAVVDAYRNHIIEVGGQSLTATTSVGMVLLGSLDQSADELISLARKAHLQAAEEGNQLVRYRPKFSAVVTEEDDREWSERIRFALNHQDFYSVQHSIVDLEGEGGVLIENRSFMREDDVDRAPEEFYPPAERADIAGTVDRHLIPNLLAGITDPNERHFVTVSGNSVADDQFPAWLTRQFQEVGVHGNQVILQVAADVAQRHLKPLQAMMRALEPTGCRLSLSGFDGDKSAERLLDHLDVTHVKLAASVSRNLVGQNDQQEIIKRIVRAAEQHDAEVVADEVQDSADLAVLWQCGVKLVIGEFLKEAPQVVGQ